MFMSMLYIYKLNNLPQKKSVEHAKHQHPLVNVYQQSNQRPANYRNDRIKYTTIVWRDPMHNFVVHLSRHDA